MNKHILFINESEDEFILFHEALKKIPGGNSYQCTYTKTPVQALEMLHYLRPGYLFFNMNMPGMDGFEFLSILRQHPEFRHIKSFLYSPLIPEDTYDNLMSSGASGWIEMTDSVEKLQMKLRIFMPVLNPSL